MRVLVTGGRGFRDSALLYRVLDGLDPRPILIIEGGQRTWLYGEAIGGADFFAWRWATDRGVPCRTVEARWNDLETPPVLLRTDRNGRSYNAMAGPNRNQEMVDLRPDLVVALPGGTGTADCCRRARAAGIEVMEVRQ